MVEKIRRYRRVVNQILGLVLVEARIKTISESVDLESGSGSDPPIE